MPATAQHSWLKAPCLYASGIVAVVVLLGCAVFWFYAPTPVEEFDSLNYCACGYSTVRFNNGSITMVKYPHSTVKPGERIGTYLVVGNQVEIDTFFKGKVYHATFTRDHIGLLNPPLARFPYRYHALKSRTPKTLIAMVMLRLREEAGSLWRRFYG